MKGLALLLALLLVTPHAIDAQENRSYVPLNVRVRLSTFPVAGVAQSVAGNLVEFGRDTIFVLGDADRTRNAVSIASLRRFEVSLGRQSRLKTGALYGLLGGILAGVVSGVVYCSDDTEPCEAEGENRNLHNALFLGVGGGLVGTGIGALVGAQIRSERWQRLTLEHLRIGLK